MSEFEYDRYVEWYHYSLIPKLEMFQDIRQMRTMLQVICLQL